jgi:arsenite/tail-anchored protein-transporting ATPase
MWPTNNPESLQQAAEAVTILLAGPMPRVNAWYTALAADARARVTSFATDPQDLSFKIASSPEALLIDASIYSGPKDMLDLLTRFSGAAYVQLPPEANSEAMDTIAKIPSVKGVYRGDVNLVEMSGKLFGDVEARRASFQSGMQGLWKPRAEGYSPVGMRIIAVWNQSGGVGKTTIATNLAYEASRRGLPTLLIGLGAPDDLPLILGLKPEPNIVSWRSNPSQDGLKEALQKLDELDVLAGFPDVLSEAVAINTPAEGPNSVQSLILTAAYAGYAVIVIDAPPSVLAASAISAANTLVLVARPSLEGVMRTVHAYRTVVERLAGEHRISPHGVFVALNRITSSRMTSEEWHKAASGLLGQPFPPIVAQIVDDKQVGELQDRKRIPLMASDSFTRGILPLANALFSSSGVGKSDQNTKPPGKSHAINLFGIKVKV